MFIYEILNTINNKRYIGQTSRPPNRRWSEHQYNLRCNKHGNPHLQNAWNKYGPDVFEFNVICNARSTDELNELEIDLIKLDNLYNIRSGGVLFYHSDETKQKISNSRMGTPAWNKGINTQYMTSDTKELISKKMRPSGYPRVVSPTGELIEIKSLRTLAKISGVDQTGLRKLVNGEYNSYNGWTVDGTAYIPRNRSISKSKRSEGFPTLISPNDTIYDIGDTLRSFCKIHKLTVSSVSNLINKKIPSYKGWKLLETLRA